MLDPPHLRTDGTQTHIVFVHRMAVEKRGRRRVGITTTFCTATFVGTTTTKGGFYSEGTDACVISSNRQTISFSRAWILKFRKFHVKKGPEVALKDYLRFHFAIWAFRAVSDHDTIWHDFKISSSENNLVRLFGDMTTASVPSEQKQWICFISNYIVQGQKSGA